MLAQLAAGPQAVFFTSLLVVIGSCVPAVKVRIIHTASKEHKVPILPTGPRASSPRWFPNQLAASDIACGVCCNNHPSIPTGHDYLSTPPLGHTQLPRASFSTLPLLQRCATTWRYFSSALFLPIISPPTKVQNRHKPLEPVYSASASGTQLLSDYPRSCGARGYGHHGCTPHMCRPIPQSYIHVLATCIL